MLHVLPQSQFGLNSKQTNSEQTKISVKSASATRVLHQALFSSQKKILQYPSHQIFGHMHRALNAFEKNN